MSGHYSGDEYQFHYWAAVGSMKIGEESLHIAVPLVMYNYPQKVTGGSVDFDLKDVEKMSNDTQILAVEKFDELSGFVSDLAENIGIDTWEIIPINTCHRHPGMMDSFSGTDYDMNLKDPGICYPLTVGTEQPSFSSIVCHKGGTAEMVHTEFRLFNGSELKKEYTYGKCMTYVRGMPEDTDEPEGVISGIMAAGKEVKDHSYYLKDRMGDDGDALLFEVAKYFNESKFEVNTTFIDVKNVTKQGYTGGTKRKPYAGSYYADMYSYWDDDKAEGTQYTGMDSKPSETLVTASKMKKDLIDSGQWSSADLNITYGLLKDKWEELQEENSESDKREEMIRDLLEYSDDYTQGQLDHMTDIAINNAWQDLPTIEKEDLDSIDDVPTRMRMYEAITNTGFFLLYECKAMDDGELCETYSELVSMGHIDEDED